MCGDAINFTEGILEYMSFLISKQPIFNQQGVTDAYELLYCFVSPENPEMSDEQATDEEIENAKLYLKENMQTLFQQKTVYVRFSPRLLKENFQELFLKEKLIIAASTEMLADAETLQKCMQLKRLGYRIAISGMTYSEDHSKLFNFADVIRFDINSDVDDITVTVKKCREKGKLSVVDNVETQDQFEFVRENGIDYVRGEFYSKPVLETKRSGGPMIKTFLQILALLYSPEPNISYISAVISTDPVLTIKLLKVINQICADRSNTVSTVQQALVMLGIDRLKEWIYLVGLQRLNRNAPAEILRLALFRARFCERISLNSGGGVGSRSMEAYLMGLISIVTGSTDAALSKALDDLPVSEEIKQSIHGGGIFSDIYHLSCFYEKGDWEGVMLYSSSCHISTDVLGFEYLNTQQFVQKYGSFGA